MPEESQEEPDQAEETRQPSQHVHASHRTSVLRESHSRSKFDLDAMSARSIGTSAQSTDCTRVGAENAPSSDRRRLSEKAKGNPASTRSAKAICGRRSQRDVAAAKGVLSSADVGPPTLRTPSQTETTVIATIVSTMGRWTKPEQAK